MRDANFENQRDRTGKYKACNPWTKVARPLPQPSTCSDCPDHENKGENQRPPRHERFHGGEATTVLGPKAIQPEEVWDQPERSVRHRCESVQVRGARPRDQRPFGSPACD